MATSTRQPFAELGTTRLQGLQSAKNRQNSISSFAALQGLKSTPGPSTGKRQRAPEIYEDADAENVDPFITSSPTKKTKTTSANDTGYVKPAPFAIFTSPVKTKTSTSLNATPSVPSARKPLSSPSSTKSTPITNSRGSPKNKRLHAISKRRASSSPFKRVDPPSFSQSSPKLPFSIDAALSGSISTYTPKAPTVAATPVSAPARQVSVLDESMPKAWFFEIHEDTPEQEAANLMEHSASVLDISSDDDVEAKTRNEDRGKENIPPPDFRASQPRSHGASLIEDDGYETEILIDSPVKRRKTRKPAQDAMDEDRKPLGDLAPCDFYGEGCDATSYVTVDAGIEKPSRLSKECDFRSETPEVEVPAIIEEKEEELAQEVPAKSSVLDNASLPVAAAA